MQEALRNSLSLLQAANQGDEKALEEFLKRYYERVFRMVRVRMGNKLRARQDSMDLTQNAII